MPGSFAFMLWFLNLAGKRALWFDPDFVSAMHTGVCFAFAANEVAKRR